MVQTNLEILLLGKNAIVRTILDESTAILQIFYTKTDNYVWNRPYEPWTEEAMIREHPRIDEKTGRRYKKVPIHAPGTRKGETGKTWKDMLHPPGKHWQHKPSILDELDNKGEIY